MARASVRWPTGPRTIFFDNVASRTTLSKAVGDGRIRRIAPRIYTADLRSELSEIVGANWPVLCNHYLPGAVIVDRSAATAWSDSRRDTHGRGPHNSHVDQAARSRNQNPTRNSLRVRPALE